MSSVCRREGWPKMVVWIYWNMTLFVTSVVPIHRNPGRAWLQGPISCASPQHEPVVSCFKVAKVIHCHVIESGVIAGVIHIPCVYHVQVHAVLKYLAVFIQSHQLHFRIHNFVVRVNQSLPVGCLCPETFGGECEVGNVRWAYFPTTSKYLSTALSNRRFQSEDC